MFWISRHLKEELTWATYKLLRVISNVMLFNKVIATSNKRNNKAVWNFQNVVCIAMWFLVTYFKCLSKPFERTNDY